MNNLLRNLRRFLLSSLVVCSRSFARSASLSCVAVVALLLPFASGCNSLNNTTSVAAIRIDVDPGLLPPAMDSLHLVLSSPSRPDLTQDLPVQATQRWEVSLTKINGPLLSEVVVTGQKNADGGATTRIITSAAYFTINPGQRTEVTLHLSSSCAGASAPICKATETCANGACVAIPGTPLDGGVDASQGLDGPSDRASTDVARPDTSTSDTGSSTDTAPIDSSAGPGTLAPGETCATTSQCASGVCSTADHVCCDTACTGTCESCVASKTQKAAGICSPLPKGSNADNDCTAGTTECGLTGFCDGNRKCGLADQGAACTVPTACSAGQLTSTAAMCDGLGVCAPGKATTGPCPGMVACKDTVSCQGTACTVDANCSSGNFCDLGPKTCTPLLAAGKACTASTQCAAGGTCVDGVCCSTACSGTCEACVKSKTGMADGRCAAVTQDTDPDNECSSDGTVCGHTGLCDHNGGSGQGACAYFAKSTTCPGATSCTGQGVTSTTTGSCSGAGACTQSTAVTGSCNGFACASASTCATSCTAGTATGCPTGTLCVGGTSCVAPAFQAGPCIVTPGDDTLEVFAHGKDQKIYRKARSTTTWGGWTNLSDLDGTLVDNRSDLDCAATSGSTIHLVATGTKPLGAFMHAIGSGTTYNNFTREFPSFTVDLNASVAAFPGNGEYYLAGMRTIPFYTWYASGGSVVELNPPSAMSGQPSFNSPVDVFEAPSSGGANRMITAFDTSGNLDVYANTISSAPMTWQTPLFLSPPSGNSFSYSPSLCAEVGSMGTYAVHVVAVAGGKVWQASAPGFFSPPFSAWEQIAASAASAPDCAILSDGSLHVVVTNSAGHVIQIAGKTGGPWASLDLGTY